MIPSRVLRAAQPGFWRRSLDEFKRQATIAVKMEGLHEPKKAFPIIKFDSPDSPQACKIMSDATNFGGYSKAELSYQPAGEEPSHVLFKGSISTELPPSRADIQRSGFAAWRTRDRGLSLFGKLLWDIDPYSYLALRIKSDGRKYFINIQTESIVPTDIHQHLLPSYTPGEWETVTVPFSAFVRTNYGMVVEPQKEMLRQKVRSVGIGLTDRVPGPFELRIADIYATNKATGREIGKGNSGFEMEPEQPEDTGMMGEMEPARKKGEPERILI
ncbi:CIA30-domain-containing protein [Teratosphaeria nubilosa]|uniref:CIA30-domain-containing protein n=1 Tax=Teratosphaeria nubilosa TaxID=161662 RepID=A0A6G1L886_9PEZI|nr:CIA30-domain-containing protein [Teratosphaeria nubilosa]